jgi:hypothetical protein
MDVDSPMVDTNENISRRPSISAVGSATALSEVSVPIFFSFLAQNMYMEASLVDLMSTVNLDELENPRQRSGVTLPAKVS